MPSVLQKAEASSDLIRLFCSHDALWWLRWMKLKYAAGLPQESVEGRFKHRGKGRRRHLFPERRAVREGTGGHRFLGQGIAQTPPQRPIEDRLVTTHPFSSQGTVM